jgi:hypothetical protein
MWYRKKPMWYRNFSATCLSDTTSEIISNREGFQPNLSLEWLKKINRIL